MKILVTGVNGQLGHDVVKQLNARQIELKGADIGDFDLTNREQTIEAITTYAPDAVIHCAAYTNVNGAEANRDLCWQVNVAGTANVALACKQLDAKMIYISTDYVFDGMGEAPFEVDDCISPINAYGASKADGEKAAQELVEKLFIVRISWVFGMNGNNFVKTMRKLGASHQEVSVVGDQVGSPTYTADVAKLLCDMVVTEKYGIYHATNEGVCSWAEFAQAIMVDSGLSTTVKPITTAEYPTPAKRPYNSRLSKISLDQAGFARLPAWQDALKRYIDELDSSL